MEIWKDVHGFEGFYQVSNYGNVKSLKRWNVNIGEHVDREMLLKPVDNGKGYMVVGLRKNGKRTRYYVHRLVAEHFLVQKKDKNVVNHKDYNKSNNNVNNLEWVTQGENVQYSLSRMRHRHIAPTNTGERYVSYRASRQAYRVNAVLDGKEYTFKTLPEAIRKRDELLRGVI